MNQNSNILLSVVICTYNRAELLNECLKTLVVQTMPMEVYEIVVIDNNCTDNTKEVVENHKANHSIIKYYQEAKVGLSHARNRGAKEARSNNLLYLDDDILANPDLCEKTLSTFKATNWPCFGGVYTQWFYYGKPKWYPKTWGTNAFEYEREGVLPDNKYAIGCIFAIRKSALNQIGGFDYELGMNGYSIGYGEETDVQIKLRKIGFEIGFNPNLKVKHIVPKHKLQIGWHLRAAWKNEKVSLSLLSIEKPPFFPTLIRIIKASIKRLKYLTKLRSKNYYWQNFLFDYSEPIIRLTSSLYHSYRNIGNARN